MAQTAAPQSWPSPQRADSGGQFRNEFRHEPKHALHWSRNDGGHGKGQGAAQALREKKLRPPQESRLI
jgi:hypothetical protein